MASNSRLIKLRFCDSVVKESGITYKNQEHCTIFLFNHNGLSTGFIWYRGRIKQIQGKMHINEMKNDFQLTGGCGDPKETDDGSP